MHTLAENENKTYVTRLSSVIYEIWRLCFLVTKLLNTLRHVSKSFKMAIQGKTKVHSRLSEAMSKSRCVRQTKHEIRNYLSQKELSFFFSCS